MSKTLCLLTVLGAALGTQAAAQILPDPVPTRITVTPYGLWAGNSGALRVECDVFDPVATTIKLSGGQTGAMAMILAATTQAATPVPWGTLLLGPELVAIPGRFGADATFRYPVKVESRDLIGLLFFQGVQIREDDGFLPIVDLSFGLRLQVLPGNPQPPLSYAGPDLTATLCKAEGDFVPVVYSLLHSFLVPSPGYTAEVLAVTSVPGTTKVTLQLVAPDPPVPAQLATLRLPIVFGPQPEARIEVWVQQLIPGQLGCGTPDLAAMIERH